MAHAPAGTRTEQTIRQCVVPVILDRTLPAVLPAIEPPYTELESQAVERVLHQLHHYLLNIASRLPEGIRIDTEAGISDCPARAIIECAERRGIDVIVMAAQSRHRLLRALLGETADAVVSSGVAPVLLVHPKRELPEESAPREVARELQPARGAA